MADYIRAADVRALPKDERSRRLLELRQELMHERGVAAMGGSPPSPGKIRQLRRQIARILTIEQEDKLGIKRVVKKTQARAPRAKKEEA